MQQDLLWGIPLVVFVGAILAVLRKYVPSLSEKVETAVGMGLVAAGMFFIQILPGLEAAYPVVMMYVQWGVKALAAALLWGGFWPIARAGIVAGQAFARKWRTRTLLR